MAEQVRLTQEKTEEVQKKKREIDRRLVTESELRATNAALERTAAKLAARADDRERIGRICDELRMRCDWRGMLKRMPCASCRIAARMLS